MPIGALQRAKRAFVGVLRSLATAYDVTVDITRDSADAAITRAYKRVMEGAPQQGGRPRLRHRLEDARGKGRFVQLTTGERSRRPRCEKMSGVQRGPSSWLKCVVEE